jgi:hypothetical protein
MTESELEYLRRRTAEELDIAERSNVLVAAEVHRRLAMLYATRVAEMRHVPHLEIVETMAEPVMEPMIMLQPSAGSR